MGKGRGWEKKKRGRMEEEGKGQEEMWVKEERRGNERAENLRKRRGKNKGK